MMSIEAAFAVPHPPIILPEIGRGEEKKIQHTIDAYRDAMRRAADLRPDTVVLTSPHSVLYADYFHISPKEKAVGDFGSFRAPQIRMEALYDTEFVHALTERCAREDIAAGTLGERGRTLDHGTMIPMRFLQEYTRDFRLVRIGLSGLSAAEHYRLGKCIAQTAGELGRRTVFIASGDLSHKLKADGPYGFVPQGPEFDRLTVDALCRGDFLSLLQMEPELCEAAGECGLRSFWILAGALDQKAVTSELLSYEGPFGVGYAVAAFAVTGKDPTRNFGEQLESAQKRRMAALKASEDAYVRLARRSLETFVKTGRRAVLPDSLPKELLDRRAGVFVSLKKNGQLRGCIGTIEPTQDSIAQEILHNAVSAAAHDPRFDPVTEEELDDLVYSVDVLGEAESIASPAQLDVQRYGVIVQSGSRRGLLLPALAGVDSVQEQIGIAKKKAGIGEDESVSLWRFEVVRHK